MQVQISKTEIEPIVTFLSDSFPTYDKETIYPYDIEDSMLIWMNQCLKSLETDHPNLEFDESITEFEDLTVAANQGWMMVLLLYKYFASELTPPTLICKQNLAWTDRESNYMSLDVVAKKCNVFVPWLPIDMSFGNGSQYSGNASNLFINFLWSLMTRILKDSKHKADVLANVQIQVENVQETDAVLPIFETATFKAANEYDELSKAEEARIDDLTSRLQDEDSEELQDEPAYDGKDELLATLDETSVDHSDNESDDCENSEGEQDNVKDRGSVNRATPLEEFKLAVEDEDEDLQEYISKQHDELMMGEAYETSEFEIKADSLLPALVSSEVQLLHADASKHDEEDFAETLEKSLLLLQSNRPSVQRAQAHEPLKSRRESGFLPHIQIPANQSSNRSSSRRKSYLPGLVLVEAPMPDVPSPSKRPHKPKSAEKLPPILLDGFPPSEFNTFPPSALTEMKMYDSGIQMDTSGNAYDIESQSDSLREVKLEPVSQGTISRSSNALKLLLDDEEELVLEGSNDDELEIENDDVSSDEIFQDTLEMISTIKQEGLKIESGLNAEPIDHSPSHVDFDSDYETEAQPSFVNRNINALDQDSEDDGRGQNGLVIWASDVAGQPKATLEPLVTESATHSHDEEDIFALYGVGSYVGSKGLAYINSVDAFQNPISSESSEILKQKPFDGRSSVYSIQTPSRPRTGLQSYPLPEMGEIEVTNAGQILTSDVEKEGEESWERAKTNVSTSKEKPVSTNGKPKRAKLEALHEVKEKRLHDQNLAQEAKKKDLFERRKSQAELQKKLILEKEQRRSEIRNDMVPASESNVYRNHFAPAEGPKKAKRTMLPAKSNKTIVKNALMHVSLAGTLNRAIKEEVLQDIQESKAGHFVILFREVNNFSFRGLYFWDHNLDQTLKLYSGCVGPTEVDPRAVLEFYKYDSGARTFKAIPTKSFGKSVDAVAIGREYFLPKA